MNKFNFDFYSNDGYPKVETDFKGGNGTDTNVIVTSYDGGPDEVEPTFNKGGDIDATEVEWTYNNGVGDGDFFF